MNTPSSFFVIVNEQGHIMHSTLDATILPLMEKYVRHARDAGDSWTLVEYKFSRVIDCNGAVDRMQAT